MSVVASVRPDSWNFPLFVHVLGAMILVGGLLSSTAILALARGATSSLRLGYFTLLAVSLPGWVLMRSGAEWIASREGWDDVSNTPTWLDIGFISADAGGVILLLALVAGGIGTYRLRTGKGAGLLRTTLVLSTILLVAYVVAIWAMAGKPS